MIPLAHGGSATAYKATVEGAQASPLSNEQFAVMSIEGQEQFVWVQNGEPGGLYCADESDGESLRVCEQINESLLGYEINGTEVVEVLAESYESNDDLTEWTFTLREGVTFHDGSAVRRQRRRRVVPGEVGRRRPAARRPDRRVRLLGRLLRLAISTRRPS